MQQIMENQQIEAGEKLTMILRHAPIGLAEIDRNGTIIHLNVKGEELLKPVLVAHNINGNNLYPVLECIAPGVAEKIKKSPDESGNILKNELHIFSFSFAGESIERHFSFMATRISAECIIVCFEDNTEKCLREQAMLQLASDKAIVQGKFEIASNVLHDIGNAVVGFGSHLSRIKRSMEQNNTENLQKLADLFSAQQPVLTTVMGEAKAGAVVSMLNSMAEAQKSNEEETRKSITDQLKIVNHIQEILNIQRQYLNGNQTLEKKSTSLKSIVNDCMSMLFASIDKRGITVSLNVPEGLPVIRGDRTRLMQVILNILKNSIEAIDINAGEKTISLKVSTDDDVLILQVKDSGNGFDAVTGKKLFVRGFTTKASGSGLGLNNCRAIIESHGGAIDIASEGFGKGSVATIKLKI